MRKQIALLTTVAALAVTPVLAQTTAPQQPATPQAQPSSPSTTSPSTMQAPADKSGSVAASGEKFVNTQTSGQWLASDIMGMNVLGAKDEKIGSVSDLLVDNDGNILAAVVGVGGFLGIGQKNIAITFDTLNISMDQSGDPQAKLTLTKEELENAPEFKTAAAVKAEAQRQTSPAGSSPATKPATPRN